MRRLVEDDLLVADDLTYFEDDPWIVPVVVVAIFHSVVDEAPAHFDGRVDVTSEKAG